MPVEGSMVVCFREKDVGKLSRWRRAPRQGGTGARELQAISLEARNISLELAPHDEHTLSLLLLV
jgi:hypothetical protein